MYGNGAISHETNVLLGSYCDTTRLNTSLVTWNRPQVVTKVSSR